MTTWPSASISQGPRSLILPDGGDPVADDADVGPVRAEPRPVDHGAVANHDVVGHEAFLSSEPDSRSQRAGE